MYSVRGTNMVGWAERFIAHSSNLSRLYAFSFNTQGALTYASAAAMMCAQIQSLPLPVPDIHFIGNDLPPYSCHLDYKLTAAIP